MPPDLINLDETLLQDAIIDVRNKHFRDWENRLSRYGVLQAFFDNAGLLIPKSLAEGTRTSARRPQKIPVLNKMDIEVLDKRSCTFVGNNGESAFANLTWSTKVFEIVTVPSRNADNYISLEEDYAHQQISAFIKVFAELDNEAANHLELNKATSLEPSQLATIGAGAYQLPIDDLYFNMNSILEMNDLYGPFLDISNTESRATWNKYWGSWGQNNNQNKSGVADTYIPYHSNRIKPGSGNREAHYFAAQGSIGVYNWNTWEAKNNVNFDGNKKVSIKEDPIIGFKWAVTRYTECRDMSSTLGPGAEQTWVVCEQWATDFAFLSAYSSDNKEPIIKAVSPRIVTPTPTITNFSANPTTATVPEDVAFTFAFANMAPGFTAELNLGLGGSTINVTAVGSYSHNYTAAGSVTAVLNLKDSGGNVVGTQSVTLTLSA